MVSRRLRLGILLGLLLACPARAGEMFFLTPEGCLPGDGGPEVAVYALVPGDASGGTLRLRSDRGSFSAPEDLGGGLWRAFFRPPLVEHSAEALFEGEWTGPDRTAAIRGSHRAQLCRHPCGSLEISARPTELVAEEDREAEISIVVLDSRGAPLSGVSPIVTASVGRLSPVEDLGQGRYRLRFEAPKQPFPQVAIITAANPAHARLDRVAAARLAIPIAGRLNLPGRTTPGVRMEMRVGEKTFGPVTADAKGNFTIPILVPPGYGRGKATSIDRVGNRKVAEVNLFLPPTNQLGIWAFPRVLPANGRARSRLLVTTIDPVGRAADLGEVRIRARRGVIGDLRPEGRGLWEAYYTAPSEVGEGVDSIEVTFPKGGSESRATVEIALLPGTAARAVIQAPESIPADGRSKTPIAVAVTDARGNPVPNLQVRLSVRPGNVIGQREETLGRYLSEVVVPQNPERWWLEAKAQIQDRTGSEPAAISITPASLQAGPGGYTIEAAVVDGSGLSAPGQTVSLSGCGEAVSTSDRFGRIRFRLSGIERNGLFPCRLEAQTPNIAQRFFVLSSGGHARLLPIDLDDELPLAGPLEVEARIGLVPEHPLDIQIEKIAPASRGGAWTVRARLIGDAGEPVAGRRLVFATSSGRVGPVEENPPGVFQAAVHPENAATVVVSVTEPDSGVSAVVRLQAGGSP